MQIGRGSFGEVYLVQNKATGKKHAMKVMRKDIVLERGVTPRVRQEIDILLNVSS